MQWNWSTFFEGYNFCQKQREEAMSFIPAVIFLKLPNSLCSYKSNSIFFSSLQGFEILRASIVVFYFLYSVLSWFCTFLITLHVSQHTLFCIIFPATECRPLQEILKTIILGKLNYRFKSKTKPYLKSSLSLRSPEAFQDNVQNM